MLFYIKLHYVILYYIILYYIILYYNIILCIMFQSFFDQDVLAKAYTMCFPLFLVIIIVYQNGEP